MSKMTDKLTPNTMKNQYDHQWNVFCKKNHDYGNSFEKSLDTFGLVAGIVRMSDKFERLVSLNDPSKDAQIASESLVDTLEDLSNYAAMAACWMKRKKERSWAQKRMEELNKDKILKKIDDKLKDVHVYSHDVDKKISDKIIYTPDFTKALLKGPKEKNDDVDVYWINQYIDKVQAGDIKIEDKPKFDGIHLFGPEKLELNLEVDQDKLFEISNALHPSTLPKSVKVNYGHLGMFEFPQGMETIQSYCQELSKEAAKKENDRVMLDMMLSRLEKGEVMRVVSNGDGSFTTYFENTDGSIDKIVDKEDEIIVDPDWGHKPEKTIEGQNGSSVTFTDGNGIFSFGKGVTVRSLGDITLTAGPKEEKKTLNEIRKEHGFDPVNGEEDDRKA